MSHLPRLHPDDLKEIKVHVGQVVSEKIEALVSKEHDIKNNAAYSVKEAAKVLGLSPQIVSRYCKRGILKARKLGKSWAIPQESINHYIKSHE